MSDRSNVETQFLVFKKKNILKKEEEQHNIEQL